MNAADTISRFASGTYAVTRSAAGSFNATTGVYAPGSTSTIQVPASIQPLGGRELLRLPEEERTKERIVIFTAVELFTSSPAAGTVGDVVAYNGKNFEVQTVERWAELGAYWKVIAAKVGQ